jgi:hypothetical protein
MLHVARTRYGICRVLPEEVDHVVAKHPRAGALARLHRPNRLVAEFRFDVPGVAVVLLVEVIIEIDWPIRQSRRDGHEPDLFINYDMLSIIYQFSEVAVNMSDTSRNQLPATRG